MPYNFHDALLEDFQIGPRQEVTLRIALYSIFYPGRPVISVRFGAITNLDAVKTYFGKIDKPEPEADQQLEKNTVPVPPSQAELKPRRQPPPGKTAMQMIQGQWPGDETTAQLLAQLKALR